MQHVEWEITKAVGVGRGTDLELTVNCKPQAGGLQGERVDFGVVLSLWVAPELNVDVYAQVQQQVASRVTVQAVPCLERTDPILQALCPGTRATAEVSGGPL